MKKAITDEKFYITDIPNDKNKIENLIKFLGYSFKYRFLLDDIQNKTILGYYEPLSKYLFDVKKEDYHTVITYDDLLANYLPKGTKVEPLNFKALDEAVETVINEDYQNEHYKTQKIDTVARCKANMTLEEQKAICIFNIDKYTHREKGQNLSDIQKVRFYLDWLEEVEKKLKDKR